MKLPQTKTILKTTGATVLGAFLVTSAGLNAYLMGRTAPVNVTLKKEDAEVLLTPTVTPEPTATPTETVKPTVSPTLPLLKKK